MVQSGGVGAIQGLFSAKNYLNLKKLEYLKKKKKKKKIIFRHRGSKILSENSKAKMTQNRQVQEKNLKH